MASVREEWRRYWFLPIVAAFANIATVAGSIASVNTVSGNDANVTTVAANIASINAVAADLPNIALKLNITGSNIGANGATFRSALGGLVTLTGAEVLTSKTLTSPVVDTGVTGTAIADQAAMEAASSTSLIVTPGRQHFHPSAVKCWGAFNASGVLSVSYNVTSITDNNVGNWTVNIGNDFSSASFTVTGTAASGSCITILYSSPTAGTVVLFGLNYLNASADPSAVSFMMTGDQ